MVESEVIWTWIGGVLGGIILLIITLYLLRFVDKIAPSVDSNQMNTIISFIGDSSKAVNSGKITFEWMARS